MNIRDGFIATVGNTPLIKLRKASEITGCTILGKAEFLNPGGSVKDRAALAIITDAEARGQLKPGGVITHISVPPMTQAPPRDDVTVKPAPVSYETRLLGEISAMIERGALKPIVTKTFTLEEAIPAYRLVMTGHVRGKVVLTVAP